MRIKNWGKALTIVRLRRCWVRAAWLWRSRRPNRITAEIVRHGAEAPLDRAGHDRARLHHEVMSVMPRSRGLARERRELIGVSCTVERRFCAVTRSLAVESDLVSCCAKATPLAPAAP